MNKVLILLPKTYDFIESSKLDKKQYEIHILHASEEVAGKSMATFSDYQSFLAQPEFLISYVDRAVSYVKKHGITAIMYCHDMSSVVASVVCEKTGLQGPTLESTFCSLHKYYTRKIDGTDMWFDFIHLDQPAETWKNKVHYPCFLKAPFFAASKGHSSIRNETEMIDALASLRELVTPFFMSYSKFFKKYLDLEKYPLAIENIVVVEDLVQVGTQYCIEGWVDETGNFTFHCAYDVCISQTQMEVILAFVFPQFTVEQSTIKEMIDFTEETGRRFGLRNTFFNIDIWKHDHKFTLVEVNSRLVTVSCAGYRKMWGVSAYELAVYLACGEVEKLRKHSPPITHQDGEPITGLFIIPTQGEGQGKDFIDYKYARSGCCVDGVYSNDGPGVTIFVEEDSLVKQVSKTGVYLCSFLLTDTNPTQLVQRAQKIMEKLILRAEDLDLIRFKL